MKRDEGRSVARIDVGLNVHHTFLTTVSPPLMPAQTDAQGSNEAFQPKEAQKEESGQVAASDDDLPEVEVVALDFTADLFGAEKLGKEEVRLFSRFVLPRVAAPRKLFFF